MASYMNDNAVNQSYQVGAAYWPTIDLSVEKFQLHCERVFGAKSPVDGVGHAGDFFLCAACLAGDSEALRLLDVELRTHTVNAIRRINSEQTFVDEILQVVRQKLLVSPQPKLLRYAARGPLLAWLGVTATRTALDLLRSQKGACKQVELTDKLRDSEYGATKDLIRARYGDAFQASLSKAVAELPPRDRNILRLYLVGRCSIDQLGTMYRVDRSTPARWLRSARKRIFDAVRSDLKLNFNLSNSEFSSIARGVQSQLDVEIGPTLAGSES